MAAARNLKIQLRKDVARAIRAGHPWIYRDALRPMQGIAPGDIVGTTDGTEAS